MHKRQQRVKLDREPAIGCRNEHSLAGYAPCFPEEPGLLAPTADMLKNGTRMDEIKSGAPERQIMSIRPHELDARIHRLDKPSIVNADGRDPAFVRIPGFEIIRMIVTAIACGSDVENRVKGFDVHRFYETFKHLPALVPGN